MIKSYRVFSHISMYAGYVYCGLHTGSAEGAACSSGQYRTLFSKRVRRPTSMNLANDTDAFCFLAVPTGKMFGNHNQGEV